MLPSMACEIILDASQNPLYCVDPSVEYTVEEAEDVGKKKGGMEARKALFGAVNAIGAQAEKGELVAMSVLQGLAVLAHWCIRQLAEIPDNSPQWNQLWWTLHLVVDVFENSSVIEKSSSWGRCFGVVSMH